MCAGCVKAQQASDIGALSKMPVKEITVFKDGHALVVHEGRMPTDSGGNVQMDYLPTPVPATFWPYVQPGGPKLTAVVASPRRVRLARTALSLKEMLQSNPGENVQITEIGGKKYSAVIVGMLYLQKGIRWIPSYKVSIDGKGSAVISLQATIINQISNQQQDAIRAMLLPKAEHAIRFANNTGYPFSTAPALILSSGKIVSQGMMTYTAVGGNTDLRLTTTVNIKVKKTDRETLRTPNATAYGSTHLQRIDLQGDISITNYDSSTADLEITRNVLGNVEKADHEGEAQMVKLFEDDSFEPRGGQPPNWWGWYSWPYWWHHFNSVGRITWKLSLQPSQQIDLKYTWNYYWE